MKNLTLQPDEHMRWIYDPSHPDYNSPRAERLRERRAQALHHVPQYLRYMECDDDLIDADWRGIDSVNRIGPDDRRS